MAENSAVGLLFDDELLRETVAAAVVKQLDEQGKEALIKSALITLQTKPHRGAYGYEAPTPLQAAFDAAVQDAAREVVRDLLRDDEALKAQVADAIREAMQELTKRSDVFRRTLADAFVAALKEEWE